MLIRDKKMSNLQCMDKMPMLRGTGVSPVWGQTSGLAPPPLGEGGP